MESLDISGFISGRPGWDFIWMTFAKLIAERSCDSKYKVGVVIVTEDNTQVLSIGYNGDQKGGKNKRDSHETGKSGFIHAEVNALIKCDYNNPKKKIMYVTLSPCPICAKCIVNAGVEEVVWLEHYSDEGLEILASSGITVRNFKC